MYWSSNTDCLWNLEQQEWFDNVLCCKRVHIKASSSAKTEVNLYPPSFSLHHLKINWEYKKIYSCSFNFFLPSRWTICINCNHQKKKVLMRHTYKPERYRAKSLGEFAAMPETSIQSNSISFIFQYWFQTHSCGIISLNNLIYW